MKLNLDLILTHFNLNMRGSCRAIPGLTHLMQRVGFFVSKIVFRIEVMKGCNYGLKVYYSLLLI